MKHSAPCQWLAPPSSPVSTGPHVGGITQDLSCANWSWGVCVCEGPWGLQRKDHGVTVPCPPARRLETGASAPAGGGIGCGGTGWLPGPERAALGDVLWTPVLSAPPTQAAAQADVAPWTFACGPDGARTPSGTPGAEPLVPPRRKKRGGCDSYPHARG